MLQSANLVHSGTALSLHAQLSHRLTTAPDGSESAIFTDIVMGTFIHPSPQRMADRGWEDLRRAAEKGRDRELLVLDQVRHLVEREDGEESSLAAKRAAKARLARMRIMVVDEETARYVQLASQLKIGMFEHQMQAMVRSAEQGIALVQARRER